MVVPRASTLEVKRASLSQVKVADSPAVVVQNFDFFGGVNDNLLTEHRPDYVLTVGNVHQSRVVADDGSGKREHIHRFSQLRAPGEIKALGEQLAVAVFLLEVEMKGMLRIDTAPAPTTSAAQPAVSRPARTTRPAAIFLVMTPFTPNEKILTDGDHPIRNAESVKSGALST